jgi:hypothetical protein
MEDLETIARMQADYEAVMAEEARRRIVVDSCPLTTWVHARYHHGRSVSPPPSFMPSSSGRSGSIRIAWSSTTTRGERLGLDLLEADQGQGVGHTDGLSPAGRHRGLGGRMR